MNHFRLTRCGSTTLMIGQIFEPTDLVDPATLTNIAEIVAHQFDRFGMFRASNDDGARAPNEHQTSFDPR